MNKRTILLPILSTAVFSSCSVSGDKSVQAEEKTFDAYIKTIDSTTSVLKNVQSTEDLQHVTAAFAIKAKAFATSHEKAEVSRETLNLVTEAIMNYQKAADEKVKELARKEIE